MLHKFSTEGLKDSDIGADFWFYSTSLTTAKKELKNYLKDMCPAGKMPAEDTYSVKELVPLQYNPLYKKGGSSKCHTLMTLSNRD